MTKHLLNVNVQQTTKKKKKTIKEKHFIDTLKSVMHIAILYLYQ